MSAPGIELRWGYGFEGKPRNIERVRPLVRSVIGLALEGLDDMGLSIDERKYVVVEKGSLKKEKYRGGAKGKTCHITIQPQELRGWRTDEIWLSAFLLHELVHLIHGEYVPDEGLVDLAASEGIAHIAQYDFANTLLKQNGMKGPPHRLVEKIRRLPRPMQRNLELEFWKASSRPDANSNEAFVEWFDRFAPPLRYHKGVTIGVLAVTRQMKAGVDIAELITMPPHEVLDAA